MRSFESRPTALVVGATGAQGGSVARHLLARGRFAVRALTREPDGPAARRLRDAGADVVYGDLADLASLRAALAGVQSVYGVTSYWEHRSSEEALGRNLVRAVAASDVQHLVLSTQADVVRATHGRLAAPHFDHKARVEDEARARDLAATYVHVAFYYESLLYLVPPARQSNRRLGLDLPLADAPLGAVSVDDVGGVIARVFEAPDAYVGRTLHVVGDEQPMPRYLAALACVLGEPVDYGFMSREAFADLAQPFASELADMFDYLRRFVPRRTAALAECRVLFPGLRTFDAWVAGQGRLLASALAA